MPYCGLVVTSTVRGGTSCRETHRPCDLFGQFHRRRLARRGATGIQAESAELSLIDFITGMRRPRRQYDGGGLKTDQFRGFALGRPAAMEDGEMADEADKLELPMRPARLPTQPVLPPRVADPPRPGAETREGPDTPAVSRWEPVDRRHMIVGREISLSGEIGSCDRLVVEGSVEANLHECGELNIAESGVFKGNALIEQAEVRGRFEGELAVRKRLLIRASGHVSGTIAYGEIEIEAGGKISGTIQAQQDDRGTAYLGRVRAG